MPKRWVLLGEALQRVGVRSSTRRKQSATAGFAGEIEGWYVREDGRDWPVPRADWLKALELFDWELSTTCSCSTWPLARHLKDFGYTVTIEVDRVSLQAYIAPDETPAEHVRDPKPSQPSVDELIQLLHDNPSLTRPLQHKLAAEKFGRVKDVLWRAAIKKDKRKAGRRKQS
jgi:hypothetical protein